MLPSGLTDREFSCEHPPRRRNEERMREGKREAVGYAARVIVSWNELLGRAPQKPR
jgi:hypothetical protein